jgi:hypothetical protein
LLYEGSTVHSASDQFVSCVYFFFVDFTFHPSPQRQNSDLYAPTSQLLKIWRELIYSEQSTLPTPKMFTIPPETPCICYAAQIKHYMNLNVLR